MNEPKSESIPDEFLMNSKVIFLSSYPELPKDLDEKILGIQLNYTPEQASAMLDNRLDEMLPEFPELSLEAKKDIITFIKRYKKRSEITFLDFLHVAVIWESDSSTKEAWALQQIPLHKAD
jgi:hypothetical protein